jgi:hypothetical protein
MTTFLGRPAWQIDTPEIRLTILECGGHVAEIVYKPAGEVNPLWIQDRPTIDSDQFDPAIHGAEFGTDGEAKLISGLAGQNLCFPYWGAPSEAELNAGMTAHGETNIVRWQKLGSTSNSLRLDAILPESRIRFERTVSCLGNVIYFNESAHNLSAWDRPVAWCEHVTLGARFLDPTCTGIQASLTQGFRTSSDPDQAFTWPEGRGEVACNLTGFSPVEHWDLVNSFLVDPAREYGHFVAWNPAKRLLIGYAFRQGDFPWMNVWECNDPRRQTRGMEFSTTPIEGTLRQLTKVASIWDVPVYEWLPAKGRIDKRYAAFVSSIGQTFPGVEDVRISSEAIEVIVASSDERITMDWDPERTER